MSPAALTFEQMMVTCNTGLKPMNKATERRVRASLHKLEGKLFDGILYLEAEEQLPEHERGHYLIELDELDIDEDLQDYIDLKKWGVLASAYLQRATQRSFFAEFDDAIQINGMSPAFYFTLN